MKQTENQILIYVGNSSAGWVDCLDVPHGQSVARLFHDTMAGRQMDDYLIRVNHQPASPNSVLQEGDRVTIIPLKPQPVSTGSILPNPAESLKARQTSEGTL